MPRALPSRRPAIAADAPPPSRALKAAALALTLLALLAVVTPTLADRGPTPAERVRVGEASRGTGHARWHGDTAAARPAPPAGLPSAGGGCVPRPGVLTVTA